MVGPWEIVTGDWATVAGSRIFPPAAFDFVVAYDVLEHLPRIGEDLALIRTVLRTGGQLFVSVPNIESFVAKAMGSTGICCCSNISGIFHRRRLSG
jgi:2-polyprenyl-3-methyl-5-hydroxy-6-metoxy-1,4-benzoquinol methylase